MATAFPVSQRAPLTLLSWSVVQFTLVVWTVALTPSLVVNVCSEVEEVMLLVECLGRRLCLPAHFG